MLDGVIGFKSSYGAIKTDESIVYLPNVGVRSEAPLTTEYRNLRSQCIFTLADLVNNHKIASRVTGRQKEMVIEELSNYQDVSTGDGKRQASSKDDIKEIIGHSPDDSDTWIMRMYFVVREKMLPEMSEQRAVIINTMQSQFAQRTKNQKNYSTR